MSLKNVRVIVPVLLAAVALPQVAIAATASSTLTVNALVLNICSVAPATLSFGNVTGSGDTDATASILVTCTLNTPYAVALDQGANGSTVTTRQMKATLGTDLLGYSLYRDSGRTQNWGTTAGTDTVDGTGSGLTQTLTVYGRVPASLASPSGTYSDTVNITVNY
ncbi:Csu type fimbrial protein [Solimonas variicoloris]|uniref:Csu type fimbrial protein n=1 Tax=Solimonas variicoloris TaxID=254408 RepID=UPI000366764D|nr:spore coat U domain-containing protein [Solimonas variicoloris]